MGWLTVLSSLLFLPVWQIKATTGNASTISDRLVQHIFSNYQSIVRPRCGTNNTVSVIMDLALRQIIELNEPKQILYTNCWMRNTWNDCRLRWNSSEYKGIKSIVVPATSMWYPDLTLYDSSAEESGNKVKNYRISVTSDGNVSQNVPVILASLCNIDVSVFPFDDQVCNLTFGMWMHNGLDVDLEPFRDGDLSKYVQHVEWDVLSMDSERVVDTFENIPYPVVVYKLVLRRKSLFYMINLIFPCMLISTVALLGFVLPSDSGEKVNLEVTVLLSLAVFQLIVLDTMPPSSETLPVIGLYFASTMVMVALSCLMTVLVLNVHFRGKTGLKPPRIMKTIIIQGLGRVFCSRRSKYQNEMESNIQVDSAYLTSYNDIFQVDCPTRKPKENLKINSDVAMNGGIHNHHHHHHHAAMNGILSELFHLHKKLLTLLDSLTAKFCDSDETKRNSEDWYLMAIILDRFFLLMFLIISVCLLFAFMVRYII